MAIVDVHNIGIRNAERVETKRVHREDSQSGEMILRQVIVKRKEAQPILTKEEAAILWEADWKESPESMKHCGKFCCIVASRRFFTEEIPVAPEGQVATCGSAPAPTSVLDLISAMSEEDLDKLAAAIEKRKKPADPAPKNLVTNPLKLKGIPRNVLDLLYANGMTNKKLIKKAGAVNLLKINGIGPALAKKILMACR